MKLYYPQPIIIPPDSGKDLKLLGVTHKLTGHHNGCMVELVLTCYAYGSCWRIDGCCTFGDGEPDSSCRMWWRSESVFLF
jgi:hypothetical protein